MPLSATQVRNAKPAERRQKLFDGRGLYLEIPARGNKRWRLKYRFEGREKLISLGIYPDISLQQARERRDVAKKLLAQGVDPSAERQAQRAAAADRSTNTFEALAREWIDRHGAQWAASHRDRLVRRLERDAFPWLGAKPVDEISPPELLEVARRIEARGAVETAHRVLQSAGQVFRYAVATGRAERVPSVDLRNALTPAKVQHLPAITEPGRVGELLRAIDGYEGSLAIRCALRLAPLVFVRPGELRHATWEHVDLDRAEWSFTVSKTHADHIVPLARQAVAILQELEPLTGRGRYVFPSARSPSGRRPMSDNALLVALRSMGFPKDEMTVHGFRAMARTLLDEVLGVRPDFIEHQLAHRVRDPLGRAYNRTSHLEARREMMQRWADYLDELKADSQSPDTSRDL